MLLISAYEKLRASRLEPHVESSGRAVEHASEEIRDLSSRLVELQDAERRRLASRAARHRRSEPVRRGHRARPDPRPPAGRRRSPSCTRVSRMRRCWRSRVPRPCARSWRNCARRASTSSGCRGLALACAARLSRVLASPCRSKPTSHFPDPGRPSRTHCCASTWKRSPTSRSTPRPVR